LIASGLENDVESEQFCSGESIDTKIGNILATFRPPLEVPSTADRLYSLWNDGKMRIGSQPSLLILEFKANCIQFFPLVES